MNNHRKTAIIVGILYIIGTVAGVLSVILTGPVSDASDTLAKVAANPNQVTVGAMLVLTMGLSLAMIPALLFPIFRKVNEVLAVGYVIFRGALEATVYIVIVSCWLLLVVLGRAYISAGAPDAAYLHTLGDVLRDGSDALSPVLIAAFSLGALMLYSMLYRSKLIPRWISVWGIIAILLHLATGFLVLFQLMSPFSTINVIVNLPIGLQEMVMAIWFIARGFSPAALDSLAAKTAKNDPRSAS